MSTVRTRSLLLLMPLAALSLAACGDDSSGSSYGGSTATDSAAVDTTAADTTPAATTPAATTPAATTPAATTPAATTPAATTADTGAAAGAVTLQLANSTLGKILVDGDGNTLYLFGNDAPNAPACDTGCLGNWPALVSDGAATVGEGLNVADVGTVTAADGSTQVTFSGHPLYSFAGDAAPGDVNGQGLGGVWYVVGADGNAVK